MKILAVHSVTNGKPGNVVDVWRIYRPLKELSKHVDWQITHQASIVKDVDQFESSEDFAEKELEKAAKQLGEYNFIFISYWNLSPHVLALLHVVEQRYGTKTVVDIDDDLFNLPYDNPFWWSKTKLDLEDYQQIVRLCLFITTTNDYLAEKIRKESKVNAQVFVIPNYISDDYKHEPIDNGLDVVIGFFGGASHYGDLHRTGQFEALEKIMHEHKNVRFVCAGQPIDHYLPKARSTVVNPVKGIKWPTELFPKLNFDIAIAPLQNNEFVKSKSNIKWQEATRMGAAFIGTDIGPYAALSPKVAVKVPNTEEAWYMSLKRLVTDKMYRLKQVEAAQEELKSWRLEDRWTDYKEMFKGLGK